MSETYPGQEHRWLETDTALAHAHEREPLGEPASVWKQAWQRMRRRPLTWVCLLILAIALAAAAFPGLLAAADPTACELTRSMGQPVSGHPFGFDRQGCDIYARVVWGARASLTVGFATTFVVTLIGVSLGAWAGMRGGWVDTIVSRLTDIVFALPLILAAIVVMEVLATHRSVWGVVAVMAAFGWPNITRITRGVVMSVKNNDYVLAARAAGASKWRVLTRHILPNAAAPIIVYATLALGTFIVLEATLSFLGVGLPPNVISWGSDIAAAQSTLRSRPLVLAYPALALALTVLAVIILGDVARDALGVDETGKEAS